MSPLLGWELRVVIFRLRGKRSLHQRLVAASYAGLRNTSQTIQPESVRASRAFVDAYDVNPFFIAGERRRCEPGSNSVIVTARLNQC